MHAAADSSDDEVRRALAGFGAQVGQHGLHDAVRELGAALDRGDNILGDYRIGRELGRGGMGVVYEAEQISVPGRRVAVKVLLGFGGSAVARRRFAREVEVVGQLDHPHIVPILSADLEGTRPFYAMKLIEGVSLRDLLQRGELHGDWRRTATMIRDLAHALHHAHERSVVHRDVKPGNVVVDTDGRAMLLDFGLARVLEEASDLTRSLDAIGTPDYMAPEQVATHFGPITARTDVYGLGVTLFECLTGRAPFVATSRTATLERIVQGDAPRLRSLDPGVPRDLENICAMAMHVAPARRYASAGAFAADLDAFLSHQPVVARPPGLLRRGLALARRHRLPTAAAAVFLATLLAAGGYWGWWLPRREVAARLVQIESVWERGSALEQQIASLQDAIVARRRNAFRPGLDPRISALEQDLRLMHAEHLRVFRELDGALETCLALDPGNEKTNAHCADRTAWQLRVLLEGGGIVSRRFDIERLQTRLHRFDTQQSHAALLDRTGQLSIRCDRGPAQVWLCPPMEHGDGRASFVGIEDAAARQLGTTPLATDVEEGSYMLRASLAGCEALVLPILVRRRAVQTAAERDIVLSPATSDEIGAGYRQVHAGFTVVEDRPAELQAPAVGLRWQDGFSITEREVHVADVVAWLGELPPGLAPDPPSPVLEKLTWPEITDLLHRLNQRERDLATGCYVALPTPEEWQRAGQGADGRPYPWGWAYDWSFSQNYWSCVDAAMALRRTRWPTEDVSPFGVRDLAGSLREICMPQNPMREIGNKQFLLCGGSYFTFRASDLMLSSNRTLLHNEPAEDVGLRLVRRPLPRVPVGPKALRLREAPDRPLTGIPAGWQMLCVSGPFFEDLWDAGRARVEGGDLVLDGFAGGFSPRLMMWHPADIAVGAMRATAVFAFAENGGITRDLELRFGTEPGLLTHDQSFSCLLSSTRFALSARGQLDIPMVATTLPEVPRETTCRIVVEAAADVLSATLFCGSREPVRLQMPRPGGLPARWRYVGLCLPTGVGMSVVVNDVTVEDG